jgi:formylglycine-generating enzyme required for sulfatase activity
MPRGGCWYSSARFCRSASRNSSTPSYRGTGVGFRLASVR